MKKTIAFILTAACAISQAAAVNIKGSVRSTEGKGISGVVVSDGLNTTVTDSRGRFKLETDEDSRFVFISTPSGYISSTLEGETLFYKEISDDVRKYDFLVERNERTTPATISSSSPTLRSASVANSLNFRNMRMTSPLS